MRPFHALTLMLLLVMAATGCADGTAFVDRGYMVRSSRKQKLPGYDGNVLVCYDGETPRRKRDQLAQEACDVYGLTAILVLEVPWQCRMTVPHLASYFCYDPAMRFANGVYANPFSAEQVRQWNRQQEKAAKTQDASPAAPAAEGGGS